MFEKFGYFDQKVVNFLPKNKLIVAIFDTQMGLVRKALVI